MWKISDKLSLYFSKKNMEKYLIFYFSLCFVSNPLKTLIETAEN